MTIEFKPSAYIAFDYKSSGDYFLPALQAEFPYPCLHAPAFEDLVDQLAGDMADNCYSPIADYLAGFDLGLWKMGFGEDQIYLAVVPNAQTDPFKAYWSGPFRQDQDFEYHIVPKLRRVAARAGAAPAVAEKIKRASLVEDVFSCDAMPDLAIDRHTCLVWEPEVDEARQGRLVDFSVWPPRDAPVPGTREDRRFVSEWQPLYQRGARDIWRQHVRDESGSIYESRFKLARLDSLAPWRPSFLGGGAVIADAYFDSKAMDGAFLHVSETNKKGKAQYEIVRITADGCASWYTSRTPLQLLPFPDSDRCLVVEGQDRLAIVAGPVSNDDFFRLLEPLYGYEDNVITLGNDVIVYFTEGNACLRMNWLDPNTMRHQVTLLEGFGNRQTIGGVLHAAFGNLQVCQGHDEWWIFNHRSNQFGTNDIAMFWNARTDQAFKIEAQDMPRQHPTIIYLRSLGRYVALDHRSVSLMVDFEKISAGREMIEMPWETA